jgi:hypothetical protein
MASVKSIEIKRIDSSFANAFVRRVHYSGRVVTNSQLHFGAFLEGACHGVMSFGPSLDKRKMLGLVAGTGWNEFIELNRMAFDPFLPRNSESRCIAIALRLLRKHCPHVKWVVSFADGSQCGDGTIYRAAGFHLTGYSSCSMWRLPPPLAKLNGGDVAHRMKVQDKSSTLSRYVMAQCKGKNLPMEECARRFGGSIVPGFQFRYIYFLDKAAEKGLKAPILPYSTIDEIGGRMYRGQPIKRAPNQTDPGNPPGEGGANPTRALQPSQAAHG